MHTEESVVEIAISETGFGKFSIKVTIICYLIYLNCALSTATTGFILPAAACDFKMNTVDKGQYSTAYLVGGCVSPIICGFLSNLKGRKWILLVSLFLQGNSDILQAFVSNYWAAMCLKFISGLADRTNVYLITYMSECIPLKQRNSLLSFMEFFWIVGYASASVLGLAIIPLHFEIQKQYFFFRTWNLYILIYSLPGILIGFWLIFFPETPKYLAKIGSSEKLLQVLADMYEQNFGKPGKEYIEKLRNSGNCSMIKLVNPSHKKLPALNKKSLSNAKILRELKQVAIVLKPFLKNTFFACVVAFLTTSSYYALFLWLPEIFQRLADFEARNKNESLNFCTVSHEIYSSDTVMDHEEDPFGCNRPINTSVFINNLVMCVACAPAIFPMTFLVNCLGFKFFLVSHCFIASAVILGTYFVNSSLQNLILLCIYISLLSVCITGSFAFFVTIFPTNIRSLGVTLTSFSSRFGGVIGNIIVCYLIDHYCFSLIIVVALQLAVAGISAMLINE